MLRLWRSLCLSPGRIEHLLGLGSQGAVLAQQQAGGHGSRAQTGQQHRRVAAGDQTGEGARHLVHWFVKSL